MTDRRGSVFGYYVVGVFDILGQSRKLLQPVSLPARTDDERRRVVDNLRETVGVVSGFRKLFRQQFETFAEGAAAERAASQLPAAQRDEFRVAVASRIVSWGMSDTYVVAVSLARPSTAAAMADIYRLLGAAAGVWLSTLATDNPMRGGVEIGTASEIGENEVYGQALVMAHHLESKVAGGPRIVVGEQLAASLRDAQRRTGDPDMDVRRAAHLATECCSLLRQDPDGRTVIDALGNVMARFDSGSQFRDVFARAHDNARSQLRRHREEENDKLVSRYEALVAYCDEQAPKWRGR